MRMCIDVSIDVCIDACIDLFIDASIDVCIDRCLGVGFDDDGVRDRIRLCPALCS